MAVLKAVLPACYSPPRPDGNGLQGLYLTEISEEFAGVLPGLIGSEVQMIIGAKDVGLAAQAERKEIGDDLDVWEHKLEKTIDADQAVQETVREEIIRARVGQGLFKQRVMRIENRCRVTGVDNPVHLIASHCKPWRDSSNEERLDGENGLLLTPSIDHLFDRGFIGFENSL